MAKDAYIGVGGKARKVKNLYIGVGGKARKVKKAYIGVGGKARLFYTSTLPPTLVDLFTSERTAEVYDVVYANGYYAAVAYRYDGSSGEVNIPTVLIAYTTDLEKSWTVNTLFSNSNSRPGCITYANGYWVVGAAFSSSEARIYYSTSLDGPWNYKSIFKRASSFPKINDIIYADGYWVVCGQERSNYASIAYATELNGTWTQKDLWKDTSNDNDNSLNCITYANGYFVVGGNACFRSSICYTRIAYATAPDGTWTTKDIWESSYSGSPNAEINDIIYTDGYWVVCGEYYKGNNDYGASIAFATNLDGNWTTKDLWGGNHPTNTITCIAHADGYWAVGGHCYDPEGARIAYSNSLSGTWAIEDLWTGPSNTDYIRCIINANGYWIVGGIYDDGPNQHARIAFSADLTEFDQV